MAPFDDNTNFSLWVEEKVMKELKLGTPIEDIARKLSFEQSVVTCIVGRVRRGMYRSWLKICKEEEEEENEISTSPHTSDDIRRHRAAYIQLQKDRQVGRLFDYFGLMERSVSRFHHTTPMLVAKIINEDKDPILHYMVHRECYLKEAQAMIEGKNWKGKNRCVKLEGDD